MLDDQSGTIIGFLISFAVIWVLWRNHHRMLEHFHSYDGRLVTIHFVWLLTIVLLPLVTALLANAKIEWSVAAYIVVLAVSVGSLMAIARHGFTHPDLIVDDELAREQLGTWRGIGTLITLAVAFVVSILASGVGSWSLFLLVLAGPIENLLERVRR